MLTHEEIWRGIDRLAELHGMSPSALARKAGLDPTTFNKSKRTTREGKKRWPSTESLAKILEATGTSLRDFVGLIDEGGAGGEERPFQRLRAVRLSELDPLAHLDPSGFPQGGAWEEVEFPHVDDEDAYVLELDRDLAPPCYLSGDLLVVSPRSSIRRGDRVLLCLRDGRLFAGRFQRRTVARVSLQELWADKAPEFSYEVDDVAWLARILWVGQ